MSGCRWCFDRPGGCVLCPQKPPAPVPMFVAKTDSPEDMALLKEVFGREAMVKAFGPAGRGMQEVELNAALASLRQALREASNTAKAALEVGADASR